MRTDSEEAIRRSIIHSLLGDLDEQESRTLENWLKTPEHQDFYKKISNREYVRCKMAGLELSDKEQSLLPSPTISAVCISRSDAQYSFSNVHGLFPYRTTPTLPSYI